MSHIDYMKVIDIAAKQFGAKRELDVKASHNKIDFFDVGMEVAGNQMKYFRLYLHQHSVEITFDKNYLTGGDYDKWLSNFEYELEQVFFRNIKIETSHDAVNYRIKVDF